MDKEVLNKIDTLLKMQDKKRKDLAKALNVTPQRVNNWFSRKKFPFEFLPEVAKFFGVTTDFLYGLEKDNKISVLNSSIIHNSPNSHISINDAINSLPPEVGAVVKYMMELNEKERLEFMTCAISNCKKLNKD